MDPTRRDLWERFSDSELTVLREGIECATDEGSYAGELGAAAGMWEQAATLEREITAEQDRRAVAGTT